MTATADSFALIRGNTFPIRDELKALGGKWNPAAKAWEVPSSSFDQAKALVDAQPAPRVEARDWVPVTGDTYAAKDILKAQFKARWDGIAKLWLVPPDKQAAAQAVVDALKGTSSPTKICWECGKEFSFSQAKRNGGDWRDSYCGC